MEKSYFIERAFYKEKKMIFCIEGGSIMGNSPIDFFEAIAAMY